MAAQLAPLRLILCVFLTTQFYQQPKSFAHGQATGWCGIEGTSGGSWVEFSSRKCYQLIQERLSWQQASEKCLSLPEKTTRLATIRSPEEQSFVSNYLFNRSGLISSAWLGGFRLTEDFIWISDGESQTYANWAPGRPLPPQTKNSSSESPQCLTIDQGSPRPGDGDPAGRWRDVYCDSKIYWVLCEQTRYSDNIDRDWKEMLKQFQKDLEQDRSNLEEFRKQLDENRGSVAQALENLREAKEDHIKLREEVDKAGKEMRLAKERLDNCQADGNLTRERIDGIAKEVSGARDSLREIQGLVLENTKMAIGTEMSVTGLQKWAGAYMTPRCRLYRYSDYADEADSFNLDELVYNPGCKNVMEIGDVESIRVFGTCVRLYENKGCGGRSFSFWTDNKDFRLQFTVRAMGPCQTKSYSSRDGMYLYYY